MGAVSVAPPAPPELFPTPAPIAPATPLSPPSTDWCEAYTAHIFAQIKDFIDGDLMRREPGMIMSSDATFSLAAITLSDGQMMVFLMGENADVIRWFVTRTESFDELKVGLLRLRDCLAASGKLDLLQFWWTDTCCERCANTPEKMREFVVEGEEKVLAATTGDVEVLRSYAKAAKRSGAPIKLGGRGTVGAQASHLTGQLEQFFRDHNSGSDTFTPGRK